MTIATSSYAELLDVAQAYNIPIDELVAECDGYLPTDDSLLDYEDDFAPLTSGPCPLFDIRRPVMLNDEVIF